MTVTAVKRSSMQGPASEGATMSAIDVTWVFGSSRATICAIVGSKIVSSSGTSSVTSRTISAQRRTSASARPTTATASALASLSAARTCSSSGSIRQLTSAPDASMARAVSSVRSPSPITTTARPWPLAPSTGVAAYSR